MGTIMGLPSNGSKNLTFMQDVCKLMDWVAPEGGLARFSTKMFYRCTSWAINSLNSFIKAVGRPISKWRGGEWGYSMTSADVATMRGTVQKWFDEDVATMRSTQNKELTGLSSAKKGKMSDQAFTDYLWRLEQINTGTEESFAALILEDRWDEGMLNFIHDSHPDQQNLSPKGIITTTVVIVVISIVLLAVLILCRRSYLRRKFRQMVLELKAEEAAKKFANQYDNNYSDAEWEGRMNDPELGIRENEGKRAAAKRIVKKKGKNGKKAFMKQVRA